MILSYQDIKTIEKIGFNQEFFVTKHNGWLQLKNQNGRCVFHNGTLCTIYDQRPEGCTLYPAVYDDDANRAVLDTECPQRHCFHLSDKKTQQLTTLISRLKKERAKRKKE
jgi:Fe-S-cluster containining protein